MIYRKFEKEIKNLPFDKERPLNYHDAKDKINEEFKLALFKKYQVSDNPKAEHCFDISWEWGHSDGLSQVELFFDDFIELIMPVIDMKIKHNIIQMLKEKKESLNIMLNAERDTRTIEIEIDLLNNILGNNI